MKRSNKAMLAAGMLAGVCMLTGCASGGSAQPTPSPDVAQQQSAEPSPEASEEPAEEAPLSLTVDGKAIEHEVVRSTNVYMGVYIFIFAFSMLLIALNNFDLITNFSAVAATLNNIGPGLSLVGPSGNFSMFSDFSKLVLIFDMLAGRLELFPLLLLFVPNTWKRF